MTPIVCGQMRRYVAAHTKPETVNTRQGDADRRPLLGKVLKRQSNPGLIAADMSRRTTLLRTSITVMLSPAV
jgi:hypothetical protein